MDYRPPSHRNLDAEIRAVTEGHKARFGAPGLYLVKSDVLDESYEVTVNIDTSSHPGLTCNHLVVMNKGYDTLLSIDGVVRCKHQALVCRRLEREGDLRFDGSRWYVSEPVVDTSDPFSGLF